MNKNPLSLQVDLDQFIPATEEEKEYMVQMRESSTFFRDGVKRLVKNKVAFVSFIGCIWALVTALAGKTVAGWASMTCIICFVSGVQLISLGIIGEYIGKVYLETKQRPRYIISERTWETLAETDEP